MKQRNQRFKLITLQKNIPTILPESIETDTRPQPPCLAMPEAGVYISYNTFSHTYSENDCVAVCIQSIICHVTETCFCTNARALGERHGHVHRVERKPRNNKHLILNQHSKQSKS